MRYSAATAQAERGRSARVIGVDATIRSDLALFGVGLSGTRWSRNLTAKIKKRSKIHVVDSGFQKAWLRGQSAVTPASQPRRARARIMKRS